MGVGELLINRAYMHFHKQKQENLPSGLLKQTGLHTLGNISDSLLQLLNNSLTLQGLDSERMCLGWGNDKGDHCHVRASSLQLFIQTYFFFFCSR